MSSATINTLLMVGLLVGGIYFLKNKEARCSMLGMCDSGVEAVTTPVAPVVDCAATPDDPSCKTEEEDKDDKDDNDDDDNDKDDDKKGVKGRGTNPNVSQKQAAEKANKTLAAYKPKSGDWFQSGAKYVRRHKKRTFRKFYPPIQVRGNRVISGL